MEKYAYITNPYDGMSIATKSIRGKNILSEYNNLKGGAAIIAGSVGAVLIVGGLFAYSMFFNVSTDDPNQKEDQKILLFTSKIINDPNASNKDIQNSLQQCDTLIKYYDTSILKINENIRNIQYSPNKNSEENKKMLEKYNKQLQYFTDKKKIIEGNKKKLEEIKKNRTTLEFNYWYEDQYLKLYEIIKESIVNQKYKTSQEWTKIANDLDILFNKDKEDTRRRQATAQRKRRERERFLKSRGLSDYQIRNLRQEDERRLISGSPTQNRFPQFTPSPYYGYASRPIRQIKQRGTKSEKDLVKELLEEPNLLMRSLRNYQEKADFGAFKTELTQRLFTIIKVIIEKSRSKVLSKIEMYTLIKRYGIEPKKYFYGTNKWTTRHTATSTRSNYPKSIPLFVTFSTHINQKGRTQISDAELSDIISIKINDFFSQQGGAALLSEEKLKELYENILYQNVFNTETIQQMPTKIIQMRNDLYRRIKERYGNIAEHLFKKHFINKKTYIKEEQLLNILKPIIKEKNTLHKTT